MPRLRLLSRMIMRDIRKEKLQFFALVILLAMGAASFNTLIIGYLNLGKTYDTAYADYNLADRWIQAYHVTRETFAVNDATHVMQQVSMEFPGVIKSFEFRFVSESTLNITMNDGFRLVKARFIGFNVTGGRQPTVNSLKVEQGRYFIDSDRWTPKNPQLNAIVDMRLTKYYRISVPSSLTLLGPSGKESIRVIGLAVSPEYMLLSPGWNDLLPSSRRFTVLYMPIESVQHLFGINSDQINEIVLTFESSIDEDRRDQVTNRIVSLLEDLGYGLEDPIDRRSWSPYELLRLDYEGFREIAVSFPLLIFTVALIGVYILTNRKVIAQRKEIGVSRALGYGRWSIVARYGSQAFMMGFFGSVIGILIGIFGSQVFTDSYLDTLGVSFRYYGIYWEVLLFSIMVTAFFSVLGAIVPAYNSSGVQPAEAMRLDPSIHITKGEKSLIERILEKLHVRVPLRLKLTLRSIFRNRRRSWGTIVGLSFSIMLILASLGMYDSLVSTIDSLQENETWSLRIQYDDFKSGSKVTVDIALMKTWNGVVNVEPAVIFTTVLTTNQSNEAFPAQLTILLENSTMHRFKFIGEKGEFRNNGIVITEPISRKLNVTLGDSINVLHPVLVITQLFPRLEYNFILKNTSLEVTGIVNEVNGLNSFLTFDTMRSLVRTPGLAANYLFVKLSSNDPKMLEQMKKKVYGEIEGVQSVDLVKDIQEDWFEYFSLMVFYVSVLILFSFIVGLTLVLNTVLINISERKRELATMRTIGESTKSIIWQLNLEHLILGVISMIFGIPLGYETVVAMLRLYNMDYFNIITTISIVSFILAIISTILIVIFAQVQPLQSIKKLNLAEATKEIL